jgi:predicted ATPase
VYVYEVAIKNFRCFEHASTTFVTPNTTDLDKHALPNVTVLIGINGTGKTSVLKAVALGLLSDILSQSGYHPYYLVRRTDPFNSDYDADIQVYYTPPPNHLLFDMTPNHLPLVTLEPLDGLESFGQPKLPKPDKHIFAVGYGATRRTEYLENLDGQRSKRRHPRFQRVAGLFEDYITLYPLAAWYPILKSKKRAREVRDLLNSLLPERTQFTGECIEGEGMFRVDGVDLPFAALSDGFRSYIGLLVDLLYHLHTESPKKKLTSVRGVVLVDDIDVHLHPAWQRDVVPKLSKTFPKLQFIVTTHSPLVVGSVHAANIRVIEGNTIQEFKEQAEGRSADQILMSSYFGLNMTRSTATELELKKLAKRAANTHDPQPAIDFLKTLTGNQSKD